MYSSFQFQMSRYTFRQEVPVHFDGNVLLVKNVTRYTTCSDVVHMLLLKSGLSVERISSYALFETTGDLERMLSGRTRIMKILRSWGCEKDNFRFELGEIEEDKACLFKLNRYSDNIDRLEGIPYDNDSPASHQELNMNITVNSTNNGSSVKYSHETAPKQKCFENTMKGTHSRCINIEDKMHPLRQNGKISKTCDSKQSKEKLVSVKKYLSRLVRFRKPKRLSQNDNKTSSRTKNSKHDEAKQKNSDDNLIAEIDDILHNQFNSLEERCRYYWNSNSESDEESDFEDVASCYSDTDLNSAFLKGVTNASGKLNVGVILDCSDVYGDDLNDAFVNEHNNMNDSSFLSDIVEDHCESLSEKSDCELDRNITSCDVVRNIFCGHSPGGPIAEDDEMDSLMRTHIYESDSEEMLG